MLRTLEAIARERHIPPYSMALMQAGLGERDEALQWLERAYEGRDVHLVFLVVEPKWDPYRQEPRFVDLLNRCRFKRTAGSALPAQ